MYFFLELHTKQTRCAIHDVQDTLETSNARKNRQWKSVWRVPVTLTMSETDSKQTLPSVTIPYSPPTAFPSFFFSPAPSTQKHIFDSSLRRLVPLTKIALLSNTKRGKITVTVNIYVKNTFTSDQMFSLKQCFPSSKYVTV